MFRENLGPEGSALQIDDYRVEKTLPRGVLCDRFLITRLKAESSQLAVAKVFQVDHSSLLQNSVLFLQGPGIFRWSRNLPSTYFQRIFDVLKSPTEVICIEEYFTEPSLWERVMAGGVLPAFEIARLGVGLANALNSLHSLGIVHCHLYPKHIFFRPNAPDVPVISEYYKGTVGGAPLGDLPDELALEMARFIAPELTGYLPSALGPSADLYALGACLFFCAAGPAFLKNTPAHFSLRAILSEAPPQILDMVPSFPPQLAAVIQKLLQKTQRRRYQNAGSLAEDFELCASALKSGKEIPSFALGRTDPSRELRREIPFVGRKRQIENFDKQISFVQKGYCGAYFVGGHSGTGKTSLAQFFLKMGAKNELSCFSVKCNIFERNIPYSALTSLFRSHAHWLSLLPYPDQVAWQNEIFKRLGQELQIIFRRFFVYKTFWPQNLERVPTSDTETDDEQFHSVLVRFVKSLDPLGKGFVVFSDDMQWADPWSLEIFSQFLSLDEAGSSHFSGRAGAGSLFLGCYRDEEVGAGDPIFELVTKLNLGENAVRLLPFSRQESDEFVELLLDDKSEFTTTLQEAAYGLALGSPFYTLEFLRASLFSGNFPTSLVGLVSKRILELDSNARFILKCAAVLGNGISIETLMNVVLKAEQYHNLWELTSDLPPGEVASAIQNAVAVCEQHSLISLHKNVVTFLHDNLRSTIFEALNEAEKNRIHALCAWALEREERSGTADLTSDAQLAFECARHAALASFEVERGLYKRIFTDAAKFSLQFFAPEKALEFLQKAEANLPALETSEEAVGENFENILELKATALAMGKQLVEAIEILDELFSLSVDDNRKARLSLLKTQYCLALFRYKDSLAAATKGLNILGFSVFTSRLRAVLFIVPAITFLPVAILVRKVFVQNISPVPEKDELGLLLTTKMLTAAYSANPLFAVSNLLLFIYRLLPYQYSVHHANAQLFSGVIVASIGLRRASERFFQQSISYLERAGTRVDLAFGYFLKGFFYDIPFGLMTQAQSHLTRAVETFTESGESLWRHMALHALVHVDELALGNGIGAHAGTRLKEIWQDVRFEATFLGSILRQLVLSGANTELENWVAIIEQARANIAAQGISSLDDTHAEIALAELFLLKGENAQAALLLRQVHIKTRRHFRRTYYCILVPILETTALVRSGQRKKAFLPLLQSWFHFFFFPRFLYSWVCFSTGEWFFSCRFPAIGERFIQSGIRSAQRKDWTATATEGLFLLGKLSSRSQPDLSRYCLQSARIDYRRRGFGARAQQARYPGSERKEVGLRTRMETQTLLDTLVKLAEPATRETLIRNLLESLCTVSGAEFAQLYVKDSRGKWVENSTHGAAEAHEKITDFAFFQLAATGHPVTCQIRKTRANDFLNSNDGSAMIVPVVHANFTEGVVYLANSYLLDLFDERTARLCSAMASQCAISLKNLALVEGLQLANRSKDDFLAVVSHELRTPLNAIMGWAELLRSGELEESSQVTAVEIIERNAHAQARIIDDLLDVSRVVQGNVALEISAFRILEVTDTALESVKFSASQRGVTLHKTYEIDDLILHGDAHRLVQCVLNLLTNAVKFSDRGGEVKLRVAVVLNELLIEVCDHGVGIDPEFVPKVFDRFKQEDSSMTRRFGGLGLGLSIVKYFVELHEGRVHAESAGKGFGAKFCIFLPIKTLSIIE